MSAAETRGAVPAARHLSAQFEGAGGMRLHLQAWVPAGEEPGTDAPAHGVIAVVHGYGDHGGRYVWLGEAMAARGYETYAYDLRGHGQSSGVRGQVKRFDDYLDDTAVFLREVRRRRPDAPVVLLGHSMGGLIAARYVEARGDDGCTSLILSSPFFSLAEPVPPSKLIGARILAAVSPNWNIGNTVQAAQLSHEQTVVDAYVTDPLVHHVAPARWAVQTLKAQELAMAEAGKLTLPLLLVYGKRDTVADTGFMEAFFAAAGSQDKTEQPYDGLYHELFNEVERDRVFDDVAGWLDERVPPASDG